MAKPPVWRVGAIMKEPLGEVLRFCAWYLAQGADEIVICFDDPQDPAIPVLADMPRLRCISCDAEFWARLGHHPEDAFVTRQNTALTWLYGQYDDGWLLNVDADEFLYFEESSVAGILAQQPDDVRSVRVGTAERILPLQPSARFYFRRPMERRARRTVYGPDFKLFGPRRMGLVGHPQGKSLVRCGIAGLRLRQHFPRGAQGGRDVVLRHEQGAHLLHMIGADYDIWRRKLAWRSLSRGFTDGMTEAVEEAQAAPNASEELRRLYERIHCASPERLRRLMDVDALLILEIEFEALVQDYFAQADLHCGG